jgi:hypothetical protein
MIKVEQKMCLRGFFKLTVGSKARGIRQICEFENLILDNGLNRLGNSTPSPFGWFVVGTGTSVPTATQTALDTFRAAVSLSNGTHTFVDGSEPYSQSMHSSRFNEGVASGNLTEIGVGYVQSAALGASTQNLFSRALILDNAGQPTSITVLSDEYLDVEYTIRVYPSLVDTSGTIEVTGSGTHAWVARASEINTWNCTILWSNGFNMVGGIFFYTGNIGTVYQAPSGTSATGATSMTQYPYENNSFTKKGYGTASLTTGNVAGGLVNSVRWINNPANNAKSVACQVQFTPGIPKTNSSTLRLGFSYSWARKT